jgi:hypothetical protein
MEIRKRNIYSGELKAQVVIGDFRSEIELDGPELLKLEFGQPGASVMCTSGTLWLTQQGDPHDHLLKAGGAYTLDQRGMVLVQGLPCGKALILPPASELMGGSKHLQSTQIRAHTLAAEKR